MKLIFTATGMGLLMLAAIGCSSKDTTASNRNGPPGFRGGPRTPVDVEPGPYYEGRKVYANLDCSRCHAINGKRPQIARGGRRGGPPMPPGFQGGPPGGFAGGPPGGFRGGRRGGSAPDLGDVGSKHSEEWIVGHIRNPQHDSPKTRMRPYGEDKINAKDMKALSDYLFSLKGKDADQKKSHA